MAESLQVALRVKTDRNGDEYLVGDFDFPVLLDLSKVSFFVFYPEEGGDRASLMIRSKDFKPKDFKQKYRSPSDYEPGEDPR